MLSTGKDPHARAAGHWVSSTVIGEHCNNPVHEVGRFATHKLGEEVPSDDPNVFRYNLTAYVCCECFRNILGPGACALSVQHLEIRPDIRITLDAAQPPDVLVAAETDAHNVAEPQSPPDGTLYPWTLAPDGVWHLRVQDDDAVGPVVTVCERRFMSSHMMRGYPPYNGEDETCGSCIHAWKSNSGA